MILHDEIEVGLSDDDRNWYEPERGSRNILGFLTDGAKPGLFVSMRYCWNLEACRRRFRPGSCQLYDNVSKAIDVPRGRHNPG